MSPLWECLLWYINKRYAYWFWRLETSIKLPCTVRNIKKTLWHWFQNLSIYKCPLSEIHSEAFPGMRYLFSLKIETTTNFTLLSSDLIKKTLQILELSRSPIFFINERYFYGFEKLHEIYLRRTFLTNVPYLSKLSTILTSLDLTENIVRNIYNMYDTNFTHLKTIYLSGNLLEIIDCRRLNFPNLMTIDLAQNRIMTIDLFGNFIFGKQLLVSNNEAGNEDPNTVMYLGKIYGTVTRH